MNGLRTFLIIGSSLLLYSATCTGQDSITTSVAGEMATRDSLNETLNGEDTMSGEDTMNMEAAMTGGELEETFAAVHHGESFNLKKGERLFFGLTGESDNPVNCASCHNVNEVDTLNWNPSAIDIAHSTMNLDSAAFAKLLLNPLTKKLKESHEGIELSGEEIVMIRHYLDELGKRGLKPMKPDPSRMILFLLLVVLFGLSLLHTQSG